MISQRNWLGFRWLRQLRQYGHGLWCCGSWHLAEFSKTGIFVTSRLSRSTCMVGLCMTLRARHQYFSARGCHATRASNHMIAQKVLFQVILIGSRPRPIGWALCCKCRGVPRYIDLGLLRTKVSTTRGSRPSNPLPNETVGMPQTRCTPGPHSPPRSSHHVGCTRRLVFTLPEHLLREGIRRHVPTARLEGQSRCTDGR